MDLPPKKYLIIAFLLLLALTRQNETIYTASAQGLSQAEIDSVLNPVSYESSELQILNYAIIAPNTPERGNIPETPQTGLVGANLKPQGIQKSNLPDILIKIMMCESGGRENAKNPNSTAKGKFQIINGTWKAFECEGNPLNGIDNTNCALKIYNKNGTKDWRASETCWSK